MNPELIKLISNIKYSEEYDLIGHLREKECKRRNEEGKKLIYQEFGLSDEKRDRIAKKCSKLVLLRRIEAGETRILLNYDEINYILNDYYNLIKEVI